MSPEQIEQIRREVEAEPPLTADQKARLAVIFADWRRESEQTSGSLEPEPERAHFLDQWADQ